MVSSDKPLIFGEKPIPISQKCRTCRQEILVSEFDFSDRARDKRAATCKSCMEEKDDEPLGACCQNHFEEMVTISSYNQLSILLQIIEALQYNEVEIPRDSYQLFYSKTN